jgi:Fe-S-cluster containining protein
VDELERIKKRTRCERCGHCCDKGGPALHREDLPLFERGVLGYAQVFTLRRGELVEESVEGGLLPLDAELVKVRGQGNRWTCLFYDDDGKQCSIYEDRPAECRAFNCWAPDELKAMYRSGRIGRADLVPEGSALRQLVDEHEARCSCLRVGELADAFLGGDEGAGRELVDTITYDAAFRAAFAERAGVGEEEMNFLFGRPLHAAVGQYGLEVGRENDRYFVRKARD